MVTLMVTASVGFSVAAAVALAGLVGIFALLPKPMAEPHDPEKEYQKLVARLRREA